MRWWALAALALVSAGCSDGDGAEESFETLPLGEVPPEDTVGGAADELAPSQIAASTVPRPDIPDPCVVADLAAWTAQVAPGSAVLRIRNDGPTRCSVDIGRSVALDPIAEPDVWLEPGNWAGLVVGPRDEACDEPASVEIVAFDVNGETVEVPISLETCGWWLTALYPVEPAEQACVDDALSATWVEADRALVVRNAGSTACALSIDAAGASTASIVALAPGDVAGWSAVDVDAETCDGGPTLPFGQAVDVTGAPGCTAFIGPGSPAVEVAESLTDAWADGSLDPFAATT